MNIQILLLSLFLFWVIIIGLFTFSILRSNHKNYSKIAKLISMGKLILSINLGKTIYSNQVRIRFKITEDSEYLIFKEVSSTNWQQSMFPVINMVSALNQLSGSKLSVLKRLKELSLQGNYKENIISNELKGLPIIKLTFKNLESGNTVYRYFPENKYVSFDEDRAGSESYISFLNLKFPLQKSKISEKDSLVAWNIKDILEPGEYLLKVDVPNLKDIGDFTEPNRDIEYSLDIYSA